MRKGIDGAARGIRTPDPLITNEVLYQLSYCGPNWACALLRPYYLKPPSPIKTALTQVTDTKSFSAVDPLITNEMLYQLS